MDSLLGRQLQLVLLPFSQPRREHAAFYRRAAACWEEVWLSLYDQHKVEHPLFLDSLLRQDEAACIFSRKQCVGMILFRTVDFSILDYKRDSYFKEWTPGDIDKLLKHGSRAFLATFLTVHPDFRHFSPDFKFKAVLLDIMVKRFKETDTDVISGITRRDRGIHDESYKLGARLVHENVDYMDGRFQVDLVAFYRHEAVESPDGKVREISDALWAQRLDLTHHSTPSAGKAAA
jgi:hypothetical protein